MSSINFTFDDVVQHVRKRLNDDAQRRWPDADIMTLFLPGQLQQLRSDRPDFFIGTAWAENYKPSQTDPLPFADEGFQTLVDALVAAIQEENYEASAGTAAIADNLAQRSRRS